MKKFLIGLFIAFMICLKVIASQWVEIYPKTYIKTEKDQDGKVYYWIKALNDGKMKPINNKKISYIMQYSISDCSANKIAVLGVYTYGNKEDQPIESYTSPFYDAPRYASYEPIIPQTKGEIWHKFVCGYQ